MKFTAALALIATAATAAEFGSVADFFGDNDDFADITGIAETKGDKKDEQIRLAGPVPLASPVQDLVSRHVSSRYGRGYYRAPVQRKRIEPVKQVVVQRQAPVRKAAPAYVVAAAPVSYGGQSYYRGDSLLYAGDSLPTYGYQKGLGYGIYGMPRRTKALIANDGYRVKRRTQVGERVKEEINAKCVLMDPDVKSDIYGVFRLSQGIKDRGTLVWGEISGLHAYEQYDLSINALGDLRDGCDSVGGIFNPFVSKSGYGHWKEPETAPGDLGAIKIGQYGAEVDIQADVDLSGSHSIIGRSMVISSRGSTGSYGEKIEGRRVGCCTIGLAAGKPKQPVYKRVSYHAPVYQAPYQPYSAGIGYGYGSRDW